MNALSRVGLILDFPLFVPFHNVVRILYLYLVPFLLPARSRVTWKTRHSAVLNNQFNVLFSDLDFDLIVPEDFSDLELQQTLGGYAKRKRYLRFLGEIEVYLESEYREKIELEKSKGRLLKFVRNFRKMQWQKNDLKSFREEYHLTKARRGLRRTESEFSKEVSGLAFLEEEQREILRSMPKLTPVRSDFFDQVLDNSWGEDVGWLLMFVDVPTWNKIPLIPREFISERKAVWAHDIFCYRAYLRFRLQVRNPSDARLENLQKAWSRVETSTLEDAPRDLPTLSECALRGTSSIEPKPRHLRLNVGVRMNAHLNDALLPERSEKIAESEQELLNIADTLVVDHPLYRLWIQAAAPRCLEKLRETYSPLRIKTLPVAKEIPSSGPAIVTFWGPLTKRFGLERLITLANQWAQLSDVNALTIVLCGPIDEDHSKTSLARLFEQTSSFYCRIEMSSTPQGILWLPYPQILDEEMSWIERASSLGRPYVVGQAPENFLAVLDFLKRTQKQV
ncbi:MAG: hypothetical protein ACK5Y2_03050 [Bdellovibrionales bacterium]